MLSEPPRCSPTSSARPVPTGLTGMEGIGMHPSLLLGQLAVDDKPSPDVAMEVAVPHAESSRYGSKAHRGETLGFGFVGHEIHVGIKIRHKITYP